MNTNPYLAIESEKAILSCLIQDYAKSKWVLDKLSSDDFADDMRIEILRHINSLSARNMPVDLIVLCDIMPQYTTELISYGNTFASATLLDQYLKLVKDAKLRRSLKAISEQLLNSSAELDVEETLEQFKTKLLNLEHSYATEDTTIKDTIFHVMDEIIKQKDKPRLKIGVPALDQTLMGFQPASLYVVGARPSVGKSVFGMIAAIEAAKMGKHVLYINREMEKENLVRRMVANIGSLNLNRIKSGDLQADLLDDFYSAANTLYNYDIRISNTARTPREIKAEAMRMMEDGGLDLIVVDYLQRLYSGQRTTGRTEEVGAISRAIKDITIDLKIPVILLAQLNRQAANNRPNMAQLRESGDIEADADAVILLHKPDYEDIPESKRVAYKICTENRCTYLEMIVDKNRDGETAIIPVAFMGSKMKYFSLEKERK